MKLIDILNLFGEFTEIEESICPRCGAVNILQRAGDRAQKHQPGSTCPPETTVVTRARRIKVVRETNLFGRFYR